MANDVFGRKVGNWGGSFKSSEATMTMGGLMDSLLVSSVQVQYQQAVNNVFDIQSDDIYFVVGRAQGQGTIGALVGPKGAATMAIAQLGDPCKVSENNITFNWAGASCGPKSGGGGSSRRTVKSVIANSVGFSIQAEDMMINEQLGFMFGAMTPN